MNDRSVVYVIDDDASMRESLDSLLQSVGHRVLAFPSCEAFQRGERPDAPSCLVLDVRLPGTSGLEFQRELTALGLPMPVVFITGHGDIPMSVAAMKAGALEFLTKPFREQDLLDAVHRGLAQDRERRAEAVALAEERDRYASLTPREQEVLRLVVAGRLNKQIAGALGLSEVTVKVHRAQVMRKMGARTLVDLVRLADRLGGTTPKP